MIFERNTLNCRAVGKRPAAFVIYVRKRGWKLVKKEKIIRQAPDELTLFDHII